MNEASSHDSAMIKPNDYSGAKKTLVKLQNKTLQVRGFSIGAVHCHRCNYYMPYPVMNGVVLPTFINKT